MSWSNCRPIWATPSCRQFGRTLEPLQRALPESVLLFDQFEEVLTADPGAEDAIRDFFLQIGRALTDPKMQTLFAMREDYASGLEPYMGLLPEGFRATDRLDLLREEAALEAITKPAEKAGVPFQPQAAQKLVRELRRDVRFSGQGGKQRLTLYVEPVQLQVVCHSIWESLAPDKDHISPGDIPEPRKSTSPSASITQLS